MLVVVGRAVVGHYHHGHAILCQLVEVRRIVATHLLIDRIAKRHWRLVVPHVVDDVGRSAVLFPKLGEFRIELNVLHCPHLAVLGFQNVVLGIMNDLSCGLCRCERRRRHQ